MENQSIVNVKSSVTLQMCFREIEINIVEILHSDVELVNNWVRLADRLQIPANQSLDLQRQYNHDLPYELMRNILIKWISKVGKFASINELIKHVLDMGYNSCGEKLQELLNLQLAKNNVPAPCALSIHTSLNSVSDPLNVNGNELETMCRYKQERRNESPTGNMSNQATTDTVEKQTSSTSNTLLLTIASEPLNKNDKEIETIYQCKRKVRLKYDSLAENMSTLVTSDTVENQTSARNVSFENHKPTDALRYSENESPPIQKNNYTLINDPRQDKTIQERLQSLLRYLMLTKTKFLDNEDLSLVFSMIGFILVLPMIVGILLLLFRLLNNVELENIDLNIRIGTTKCVKEGYRKTFLFNEDAIGFNFCCDYDINLLISNDMNAFNPFNNITCPENVKSITLYFIPKFSTLQKLFNTFEIQNIIFESNSTRTCSKSPVKESLQNLIESNTLRYAQFNNFYHCTVVYKLFFNVMVAPNLHEIEFQCNTFLEQDIEIFNSFSKRNQNLSVVRCADKSHCSMFRYLTSDLNLRIIQTLCDCTIKPFNCFQNLPSL